ncbi:hypothetical protein L3Q82_010567, partial [Scortum barcoo]
MKSFERLVLTHLKDITGPLLVPLQFAYWANSVCVVTPTDSQDCRKNHWCQPALHSGLVHVQIQETVSLGNITADPSHPGHKPVSPPPLRQALQS